MDKQPVGQLPDLTQSNNDDEIMVITDSEHNQLKKEKISDLITDFTSTNENNALTKGTDGKLFVTDFGNASNITEGTLPTSVLPDIPKSKLPDIETADLPLSGVTADTYAYPSSVTVNAQGMVTSISEGSPSGANANTDLSNLTETGESHFANPNLSNLTATGEKHFLNKTQITNCILEAPNGVATYSGSTITVKQGLKVLIPNGRNADGTLKNVEYSVPQEYSKSVSVSDRTAIVFIGGSEGSLHVPMQKNVTQGKKADIPLTSNITSAQSFYLATDENKWYIKDTDADTWEETQTLAIATCVISDGTITSFTPYQPVELLKRSDKAEIVSWGMPDYSAQSTFTLPEIGKTFTVPYDCLLSVYLVAQGQGVFVLNLNNASGAKIIYAASSQAHTVVQINVYLKKGWEVYRGGTSGYTSCFITPLIGTEGAN